MRRQLFGISEQLPHIDRILGNTFILVIQKTKKEKIKY
jgi:hypothetical protein